MDFELFCDVESLDLARSGSIWGNVWIDVAGCPFPESNWNDMPVAFLAELLDAFAFVRHAEGGRRRVRFFDGPFWIDLVGQGGGAVSVSLNAHGAGKQATVSARDMARSLGAVRMDLVRVCLEHGWGEQMDVRRLQAQ
ncbi:hypothetical protein [Streptomyces cucumeris]|uniref:hypothetical protein n=1 Tax=Streptomyces cucumeris TaxID=2962890 RepID=UPI0020C900B3|nr:hypothetical protein [Streptomyces sp. NEAU-Y11]MCP9206559.1 hypothetical protein [Streptomyces sp. NEAU-Y11]